MVPLFSLIRLRFPEMNTKYCLALPSFVHSRQGSVFFCCLYLCVCVCVCVVFFFGACVGKPAFHVAVVKNPPTNAGNVGSIPGSGRSHGGGNGNPLQYSYLGNPVHRGAWRAIAHRVARSWTWLSTCTHEEINVSFKENRFFLEVM